ncbi:MAG TPA: hypothetical protein VMC82_04995 [Thermoplasmata archaeon]|nr:hypothetical protein [Thermoplasmata archaeon]
MIFLGSSSSATVGYAVYAISIVWLTHLLTGSLFDVGVVIAIEYGCYTLTFLLGPFVDRVRNQATIFLASYPIQAVAAAVIGIGALRGFLSVDALFLLVALISILWDMTWAAMNAAPGVLLTPDEQFAASGVSGAIGGGLNVAGYAIGGVLILAVGAEGGMLLYAGLLALGAILAVPMVVRPPQRSAPQSFSQSFAEGWSTVLGGEGRPFLQLALVDSVEGFLASAGALLIALLAIASYGNSATAYGVMFTAFVVGGVVGGLFLGQWNPRGRVGVLMPLALIGSGGAFLLAVFLPPALVLTSAAWVLVGFASASYLNTKYSFFRGSVPADRLGRFVSNMYLFPGLASIPGALILAAIAAENAPIALGLVVGLASIAAGAIGFALPAIRGMHY